jgi:hydroxypyruvate isomerase
VRFSANLSMLYPEHGFLDRFDAAAADGFRGVEFVSPYEHAPDVVAEATRRAGVEVVLFNSPAGDWAAGERGSACDPAKQDVFRAGIERAMAYAEALNCPKLHIMAGILPDGVSTEVAEAQFIDNLAWAAARLDAAGVLALIEPINPVDMPGYGLARLGQAERVLASVNHPNLRLQYDFYHMAMMGEALVDNFGRLLPFIGHVQVADQPGRHEPGSGTVDFATVFTAIRASGYDGWVGAEYRPLGQTSDGMGWMRGLSS